MNPNIARKRHSQTAQSHNGGPNSAANKPAPHGHEQVNVGDVERQFSMIGGTVLAVCGLLRGSMSGLALATLGGALIWRGHTGHCEMYHMLGHSSAEDESDKGGGESHSHGEQAMQSSDQHLQGNRQS